MAFGELVLWKRRPVAGALGKLLCMWNEGVVLGVKASSGECMSRTPGQIGNARTIARKPLGERWNSKVLGMVGGALWRLSDDHPVMDGDAMKIHLPREVVLRAAAEEAVRQPVPKRM